MACLALVGHDESVQVLAAPHNTSRHGSLPSQRHGPDLELRLGAILLDLHGPRVLDVPDLGLWPLGSCKKTL